MVFVITERCKLDEVEVCVRFNGVLTFGRFEIVEY